MELFQAILERRSIRKFTSEPVSREELLRILEAGIWAPSGLNNQPWRFVLVQDSKIKERLAECTKYGHIVRSAQALIVVFLDKKASYHHIKDAQAIGACIQNMLLAIHGLNLGGVWLGEILNQEARVQEILGTNPEDLELMAVIALGHPAQKGSSSRKELESFILKEF
ncbi:MAG TPA: nitroreductase family protein [Desulfonauticus sp.]|nr:MAG: Nitroreductase [Desulfonauticus sp. 38_4375]HCO12329.1 nitroreductase family protein [Desulfonauticus sp.]